MTSYSFSPRPLRNLCNAAFCNAGFPMRDCKVRSTVSHNQVHAISCFGPQSLTRDRRDASMTDLYSGGLIFTAYLARRRARTSISSWKRCELETFVTIASNDAKTSFIQAREPKPMTAELNVNMSWKFFGTEVFAPLPLPVSMSLPAEPRPLPELDLTPNHPLRLRSNFFGLASPTASFPGMRMPTSTAPSACCSSSSSSTSASSS
mmetsp:Transcript_89169/g.257079  ORF Transcript_89169/g.257079 Transcript_89169/m.257079 type:complete len:206 (-) Transcript_89169:358-975(-)